MRELTDEQLAQDDLTPPGALPAPQTAPGLREVVESMWEERRYRAAERRPEALERLRGGRVVIDARLARAGRAGDAAAALAAHLTGDWGTVTDVTARHNEEHLLTPDLLGSIVSRHGDLVVMTILAPTGTTTEVMADPLAVPGRSYAA